MLPDGVTIFPLDDGARADLAIPAARGLESVRLFFENYVFPMAHQTLPVLARAVHAFAPDVMVVDHQMPAGALLARGCGVKWATLVTSTASIQIASTAIDAWVEGQFAQLQACYLPPEAQCARPDFSPFLAVVFSIEGLMGTRAVVPAPYLFVGPAQGGARRPVAFPWEWVRADRKLLLVSLGTVSRDRDTRFFDIIMQAVDGMVEVQAVLVAPAHLAAVAPPNVLVRDYVPQLDLLDRAHGVVCHAGHNTVCEALTRGLPLVVAPIRDDQPAVARQVIDAGAGLFMRHGKVTVATARSTIESLLTTPALAERARALGAALRAAPGAAGAAAAIAALAA
jgi:hypothetical protein